MSDGQPGGALTQVLNMFSAPSRPTTTPPPVHLAVRSEPVRVVGNKIFQGNRFIGFVPGGISGGQANRFPVGGGGAAGAGGSAGAGIGVSGVSGGVAGIGGSATSASA